MARAPDLESLRTLFRDDREHAAVGRITKLGAASDRSMLRVQVEVFPSQREVVAIMTWDVVGTDSGEYEFPSVNDLVLVMFVDGNPDDAFVIRRLSSKEDTIPTKAMSGHRVSRAKTGKRYYLAGDQVHIGKADADLVEPLVLGATLKDGLTELFGKLDEVLGKLISGPIAVSSAPGQPAPTHPALVADLTSLQSDLSDIKAQYLDDADTNIVSQFAFTERGD